MALVAISTQTEIPTLNMTICIMNNQTFMPSLQFPLRWSYGKSKNHHFSQWRCRVVLPSILWVLTSAKTTVGMNREKNDGDGLMVGRNCCSVSADGTNKVSQGTRAGTAHVYSPGIKDINFFSSCMPSGQQRLMSSA